MIKLIATTMLILCLIFSIHAEAKELSSETIFEVSDSSENVSVSDIHELFNLKVMQYMEQFGNHSDLLNPPYYIVHYDFLKDIKLQNSISLVRVIKNVYETGTVYTVGYIFSNGFLIVMFSSSQIFDIEQGPSPIITFRKNSVGRNVICSHLNTTMSACKKESEILDKIGSKTSNFDFIPFK